MNNDNRDDATNQPVSLNNEAKPKAAVILASLLPPLPTPAPFLPQPLYLIPIFYHKGKDITPIHFIQ